MKPFLLSATALVLAAPAVAQGLIAPTQRYETPLYKSRPSTLDKNYGLPTFGMPGAELPKQRTMAPVVRDNPSPDGRGADGRRAPAQPPADESPEAASGKVPDFFAAAPNFVLPSERGRDSAETPLFTTSTAGTEAAEPPRSVFAMPSSADARTEETPLFTTGTDASSR